MTEVNTIHTGNLSVGEPLDVQDTGDFDISLEDAPAPPAPKDIAQTVSISTQQSIQSDLRGTAPPLFSQASPSTVDEATELDPAPPSLTSEKTKADTEKSKAVSEKPKDGSIKLSVPYFNQRDNKDDGDNGDRSCYSSSSAMLAKFALGDKAPTLNGVKPTDPNWDAQYLAQMSQFGDTTSHAAQTAGLRSIGVNTTFNDRMGFADLDRELAKGKPVAIGINHHGGLNKTSGGHWIVVTGKTASGDYIVNDPYGKLDQVNGSYPDSKNTREGAGQNKGEGLVYSRKTLEKRWTVEGGNSGWGRVIN